MVFEHNVSGNHGEDIGPLYDDGNLDGAMKSLGQIAYEAYYGSCNGLSITGASLPEWQEIPDHIKSHWHVTANRVRLYVEHRHGGV